MTPHVTRYRFTVDDYYKMAAAGILSEEDRVELIDGVVVQMPPIGREHSSRVGRVSALFFQSFGEAAIVWVQNPIQIDVHSLPQPDVALLRPRSDFYRTSHPAPEDVFVLVEVTDTTLHMDREIKAALYAAAGIPEYWMLDVQREALTAFRDPGPEGYRTQVTMRRGDRIAPLAFPSHEIAVGDMLGA